MSKRYGIDLGTTYSLISRYDESRKEVRPIPLETEDGETASLRSVILYPPDGGDPVVGEVAWNTRKQAPDRAIVGVKRKMGEDWTSEAIDGRSYTPQEVSAEILRVLKRDAEIEMGEEVVDVVVTVPAYFGERQCAATLEAAALAGLNVLNILSEPHAAAVAYSIERSVDLSGRHVLVYDLGGGTFDVTLIKPVLPRSGDQASSNERVTLDTLCKDGNRELGGLDWDDALVDLVAGKCLAAHGIDPRLDPKSLALLNENCERAKRALSKKSSEDVLADLSGHMVTVTREEFEQATSSLLLQTRMRLEQVLAEAESKHGIGRHDIDVLVCGGATRMPMVKAMITEVMGAEPLEHRNPQLLVANGAAYVAHAMDPDATIPLPGPSGEACDDRKVTIAPDSITDITCHAVGMQVIRKGPDGEPRPVNAVVLERGTPFGEFREFVTQTLFDDQAEVCIRLFEGDHEDPEECQHLMDFRIEGLPAGRPAGRPIRTMLWFGSNGVILGSATDLETDTEIEIHYDRWGRAKDVTGNQRAPSAPTRATATPPTSAPAAQTPASEPPPLRLTDTGTQIAGPFDPGSPFGNDGSADPAFDPAQHRQQVPDLQLDTPEVEPSAPSGEARGTDTPAPAQHPSPDTGTSSDGDGPILKLQ